MTAPTSAQSTKSPCRSSTPTLLPPSTPLPAPPPSASFQPPKLVTDDWSGQSYEFYPWLSSVLNGFSLTRCDDPTKLALTLQEIRLNKRGSFNNINDWTNFKTRLIEEFSSIEIFGHVVNQIFDLLSCYELVQEIAEDLAPKIKTLQANLEIIQQFHNMEDLHSVSLTQRLIQTIMTSPWK